VGQRVEIETALLNSCGSRHPDTFQMSFESHRLQGETRKYFCYACLGRSSLVHERDDASTLRLDAGNHDGPRTSFSFIVI
jgi:hypothetical protein